MAQVTSGKVLREARERKGYDLNTVARRLRIRPDILRAIEAGDIENMPPRGYARNMVNAYARLLGLNPTEIVNMYLDEAYASQVEKARDSAPSSGFHMERETRQTRSRVGVGTGSLDDRYDDRRSVQNRRVLYDDGTPFARDDYGVTRERTNKAGRSDRDFSSHHSGYETTHYNFPDDRSGARRGNKHIYAGQTPMQYSASRLPPFLQNRAAVIALAAIILIVIIAIVVIIGGSGKKEEQDVSQLPVSGISDTTGTSDSASSAAVEVAPTSARVVYKVESGNTCYVETYTDGTFNAEELTGPAERTVDVTGTFVITTVTPDYLTVTVDGEKVTLTPSEEYSGLYAYKVDFPAILEQWRAKHPSGDAQRSAAQAQAQSGSTSNTGNTANTGATGTTQDQNGAANGGQQYYDETTGMYVNGDGTGMYGYDDGTGAYGYGDGTGMYGYDDGTGMYGDGTGAYGYGDGTGAYGYGDGTGAYGYDDGTGAYGYGYDDGTGTGTY